jgi:hypothetical protein
MRGAKWTSLVLGLAALMGAAGCGGAPAERAMVVEVRDAEDRVVEGAGVSVVPSNATHPFRVSDYVDALAPIEGAKRTGADGRVEVVGFVGRPNKVVVIVPGLGADSVWYEGHPADVGGADWRALPLWSEGSGVGASYRIRIVEPAR